MECVSISSNDMLQLGVVLLSYMEVLQDSTGKKGSHTSQTENNKFSNAHAKIFLKSKVQMSKSWCMKVLGSNLLRGSMCYHFAQQSTTLGVSFCPGIYKYIFQKSVHEGTRKFLGQPGKCWGHMKCIKNVNIPSGFTLLQALLIHRTRALEQTLTVLTVQRINKIRDTVKFYKSLKTFCHKDTYHICLDFLKHDSS